MKLTRCSYAERSTTIVQGDLRDGSEEVLARGFQPSDRGDQERCDASAQHICDETFGGGETEYPIRRGDQAPSEADPLGLIAIEKAV